MKAPDVIDITKKGALGKGLEAARLVLESGGVVAYPTESFYGLAVDPRRDASVERLFEVKRRAPEKPILLILSSRPDADRYAVRISEIARTLMEKFWPGGLTLVFEASREVNPLLTAGTGKIGLRHSSHPVARALAAGLSGAVTGTSANLSGQPSNKTPQGVLESLGGVDLVLDGGETPGGRGSTVVDVSVRPGVLLREGMIGEGELAPWLGRGIG